jgi:enterochelin esterase-like enzyme
LSRVAATVAVMRVRGAIRICAIFMFLAAGTAAGRAKASAAPAVGSTPQAVPVTCPSPALGGSLPADVYLPTAYAQSSSRYPVIYVLHGLPADPQTYTASGFVAAAVAAGARPAIVVSPQGARAPNSDPEYLDHGAGRDWPQAIADDLPRCIDSQFRTVARRSGRALIGFSAGGFGAMNIGLRHLKTYGAIEAWSGYFEATDPSGSHVLSLGSPAANAAARVPRGAGLARELDRRPTFVGFFIGNQDGFLADDRAFNTALGTAQIHRTFAVYPGGHAVSLWEHEAPWWLGQALKFLAGLRGLAS